MNWYTLKEVSYLLQVTDRTIYSYIKRGILSGEKIGGKWHFSIDEIQKIIRKGDGLLCKSPIEYVSKNTKTYHKKTMFSIDVKLNQKSLMNFITQLSKEYNENYNKKNNIFLFNNYKDSSNITLVGNLSYVNDFSRWLISKLEEFEK